MPDLQIELFSEEIPARMQAMGRDALKKLVTDGLVEAGLTYEGAAAFSTPRRLALTVQGLDAASKPVREERKGPKADAPAQAIEGFLRSTGLTRDQLESRDTGKGHVLFAVIEKPGRPAAEITAEVLDHTIRTFPWPKSMRWGSGSLRWVRPLHSILCILTTEAGAEIVPLTVDGIAAGDTTEGHRFMGAGVIRVTSFDDYAAKLKRQHVILDPEERAGKIWHDATNLAFAQGLEVIEDKGLLTEVAGLVEWPVVLMGRIGEDFLGLPPEVLQTSMKEHQKFFSVRNPKTGRPDSEKIVGFVTVANRETADHGETILKGNQKVLAARLSDARFFWENDLREAKAGMGAWAEGLKAVTFHNKLGTQADRIDRIAALAREIAPMVGADPDVAEQAARVAKLDLRSGMVGEFPELQGVMGRYYINEWLNHQTPRPQGSTHGRGPATEGTTTDSSHADRGPVSGTGRSEGIADADAAPTPRPPSRGPDEVGASSDRGPWSRPGRAFTPVEAASIADAVRDHYSPLGPSDAVPTAPVSVAVALADKIDTLTGFWAIDEKPTGSKDPFALRRAALGVIRLVVGNGVRVGMSLGVDLSRSIHVDALLSGQAVEIASEISKAGEGYRHFEDLMGKYRTSKSSSINRLIRLLRGDYESLPARDLFKLVREELTARERKLSEQWGNRTADLLSFLHDRLKVYLRDQGIPHDVIDAVLAMPGNDDLTLVVKRAEALAAFLKTDDGANLLQGFKRANNIWVQAMQKDGSTQSDSIKRAVEILSKAEQEDGVEYSFGADPRFFDHPAEHALFAALDAAEKAIAPAMEAEDFAAAMSAMARLRAPIDAFFEAVQINTDSQIVRRNRLNLLSRIRMICLSVADLTKLEG